MAKTYYPFNTIEPKWQAYWEEQKTFKTTLDTSKPKFYCLDMFPYPSGAGLHVGHPEGYTATDIISRYKRMQGFNVLHPMGWDAFGHPAERYAIKTGTHPKITTQKNIATFRAQIKRLGFSYDWDREIDTTDPKYFRWTQWIFLQLHKKGLAYLKDAPVNWCDECKIVLANEEVDNAGRCEQGHIVERRPMKQWMLKITAYAERLLHDLDTLDWPESIKKSQRDWIGKSEGAEVVFSLEKNARARALTAGNAGDICVFTTRPDTLFGATYMVLAPEHPLVKSLATDEHREAVEAYQRASSRKSELNRTDLAKEKTGVFTGSYAINPVNDATIPIWIADYVLMSYGTGAIMAVPAHDERDFEFARAFQLPIQCIIDPACTADVACGASRESILQGETCWTGAGCLINSSSDATGISINGLSVTDATEKIIAWLEAHQKGKQAVNYKLRDWLFSRQRYWGEPFPILYNDEGDIIPLDESDLPLELPEVNSFQPSVTGESPLAEAVDWVHLEKDGKRYRRETNTMPQWAGSCWYYLRFIDPENDHAPWAPEKEKYWLPVDLYIGGAEHAVLHLLYSRFWHKVLYDIGLVKNPEPFRKLFNQGMILSFAYQDAAGHYINYDDVDFRDAKAFHKKTGEELNETVEKMSKSLGNVINPDDVVADYGADAFRLYEMFLGPLEKTKPWNTRGIEGVFRFLQRTWSLLIEENGRVKTSLQDCVSSDELKVHMHKTIKGVTDDLEGLRFNTAISKLMVLLNALVNCDVLSRSVAEAFLLLLAPLAPHIAEELWQRIGNEPSIQAQSWPQYDAALLVEKTVTIIIQIQGKMRDKIDIAIDCDESLLKEKVLERGAIKKHLSTAPVKKWIIVPNKLVNIVI